MLRFFTTALSLAAFLLTAAACSPKYPSLQSQEGVGGAITIKTVTSISVKDASGTAVPGATVMIGMRENVPFTGNVLTADSAGDLAAPKGWTDPQPITVEGADIVRATWMGQAPNGPDSTLQLVVRRKPSTARFEMTGKTTGYADLSKDDWVDVGMIFPALKKSQIASLQVTDLISTEVDTIKIFGQSVDIPTNISLPKQVEHYYFDITLDKPIYRSFVNEARNWKIVAAHARFPFETVIDELRAGKKFYDVLNYFEFTSASLNDNSYSATITKKDLKVDTIAFQPAIDVSAPKFDTKYAMLAISVADSGGMLYPTDVKSLKPSETRRLVAPPSTAGYVVGALREVNAPTTGAGADSLSAVIAANNMTSRFEFIDVPTAPATRGKSLILSPPATVATVSPMATYAILNRIEKVTSGKMNIDKKTPAWDIYANGWSTSMDLPEMPAQPAGQYRWEVLFGGAPTGASVRLAPDIIDGLTHLAKSSIDL